MEKYTHPIHELILLDEGSALKRRKPNDNQILIYSPREAYIYQCSQGVVVLGAAVEKAVFSIELLAHSKKALKNSIFSHAEQIQFAIENYLIRSATIYDRALIFVSHLLDLGVDDKSIDHSLIVTNRHVVRYQLVNELKRLSKVCREFTEERNAVIHHRGYQTETFNKFALLVAANDLNKQVNKKLFIPQSKINEITEAVLSDHTIDFEEHLEKVRVKLRTLLDTAAKVYRIRRETYSDEIKAVPIKEEDLAG